MDDDHGMNLTFSVHPRPATDDPVSAVGADRLPPSFVAEPMGTAADDVSQHDDTAAGDLAFLARFAFGGY